MIAKLLRKNTSPARIAGFVISNLIGLAIIGIGLQFYLDARPIWQQKDSFLKSDYLAINKIVDASATFGSTSTEFTAEDISQLEEQPWVDKVGKFRRAAFRVYASVGLDAMTPGANDEAASDNSGSNNSSADAATPSGVGKGNTSSDAGKGSGAGSRGRRMSTAMFLEAVPEEFLDVKDGDFRWDAESPDVPIIISKDYLALYNFGFATSAGLPQLSESLISGLPLQLTLTDESGRLREHRYGRVVGYSNRFNTILVPDTFISEMNRRLAPGVKESASRLIVDVNSPGDAAIAPWLEEHGWEVAGNKSAASAAYMLKVVSGIVIAIGGVITLLSLLILILSVSLLMEKNRRKLHSLLMLGYPVKSVAWPYCQLTAAAAIAAELLAICGVILVRGSYIAPLRALGAGSGSIIWTLILLTALTLLIIALNWLAVGRRVRSAWR